MSTTRSTYNPATEKVVPKAAVVIDFSHGYDASTTLTHLRDGCTDACSVIERITEEIAKQTTAVPQPRGLGAVVEVDGDVRFVRLPDGTWQSEDETQPWHNLNVVRVLSEGVTA